MEEGQYQAAGGACARAYNEPIDGRRGGIVSVLGRARLRERLLTDLKRSAEEFPRFALKMVQALFPPPAVGCLDNGQLQCKVQDAGAPDIEYDMIVWK